MSMHSVAFSGTCNNVSQDTDETVLSEESPQLALIESFQQARVFLCLCQTVYTSCLVLYFFCSVHRMRFVNTGKA